MAASQSTLKQCVSLLKSDKSKDRQQGLSYLRDAFGRKEAVRNLDADKKDGRAWLIVFQALFTAILADRAVVLKKGSLENAAATTVRRLEEAAAALRWLVERSVTEWNSKVCKPLLKHLLQAIVHQGKLFLPVALHYVKALRAICAYPPHLDHIQSDDVQCMSILSLAFAAVLGDNLRSNLEDEDEEVSEDEVIDELSEDGEDSGSPRKRKRSPDSRTRVKPKSVSLEQIEFVAVISAILRSPRIQLNHPDHPNLPWALLDRFKRFFRVYSTETSAHLDVMSAMNSSLSNLALNRCSLVTEFGTHVWDSLLTLWSTKSRDLKESVLAAMVTLLPYVCHPDAKFNRQDGIGRLLRLLHSEHDARWGFEALSMDTLRLEVTTANAEGTQAFSARTFTHGFGFNASQVVAWTVIELQADCMKELYILAESIHPGTPREGKRTKVINPIANLLRLIRKHQTATSRSFLLQCLLFFIDRHWELLHSELRLDVANTLLHVVTIDDAMSQSWAFACLAALSTAENDSQSRTETTLSQKSSATAFSKNPFEKIPWDVIWSHAMRKAGSPIISRPACHTAHALLIHERLTSSRFLTEIEAMILDISVQGPIAPFDSVCAFLSRCLKVASQDARLYRMHMEDKVLSWLSENMNSLGGHLNTTQGSSNTASTSRLNQYYVRDILSLLETACGLSQHSFLKCPKSLPGHFLVGLQRERSSTAVIRNFALHAKLPASDEPQASRAAQSVTAIPEFTPSDHSSKLVAPGIKERKASSLFLKLLESIVNDWDSFVESKPSVESVRRLLDFAVTAIAFEGLLVMNGMCSNRKSILVACKLITSIVQCLIEMHWTYDEMVLLCEAFLPLTNGDCEEVFEDSWEAIVESGPGTGISVPVSKMPEKSNVSLLAGLSRKKLQGIIWQSADVQDALEYCVKVFKIVLTSIVSDRPLHSAEPLVAANSMVADDEKDDFAPIRTAHTVGSTAVSGEQTRVDRRQQDVARICVDVLTMIPILQSTELRGTRDKFLSELFCESIGKETFLVLVESFISQVKMRNIYIASSTLDRIFTSIGNLLQSYRFGQSENLQMLAILLLHSTANVWLDIQTAGEDVYTKARELYRWAVDVFRNNQLRCWRTRNKMVHFLEYFLQLDPHESFITTISDSVDFEENDFPGRILPLFNKDCDIRVRFTAVCASSRLFSTPYIHEKDALVVYGYIRDQLCIELTDYEEMLTRLICLGNIVVTSSSVRRGPLWHTLETCLYTARFIPHVTSIMREVARKMGMGRASPLLESYASQIAFSVRLGGHDIFRLPPQLFGYRTKREYAEASFLGFSPINLMADANVIGIEGGRALFKKHCGLAGWSEEDGLRSCFPDVVGYYITSHMQTSSDNQAYDVMKMDEDMDPGVNSDGIILDHLSALCPEADIPRLIEECVDGIIVSVVRSLSDFDHKRAGPIVTALEEFYSSSEKVSNAFRSLMRFRGTDEFHVHEPSIPSCTTRLVLKSLGWLSDRIESVKSHGAVYHVLQTLFAEAAKCPVVNEQIRLMVALCVYISVNYIYFKNISLLRVLLNGSASLLANPFLVDFSQGILDWTFIHIRELNCDVPHLSAILIRIGCASKEYCQSAEESTREKGARLKSWIEGRLQSLISVTSTQFRVLSALAAWPDQLPDELEDVRRNLTSSELSAILDDPYLPSYCFKIVRLLLEAASGPSYTKEQFAKNDFWRLKDSIPSSAFVDNEAAAFSKLLVCNLGRIDSHTLDQQHKRSIAIRHQQLMQKEEKNKRKMHCSIKLPIVMALLDLLSDEDSGIVSVAYQTLRRIAATDPLDSVDVGLWPVEYRTDAVLLNFCPIRRTEEHNCDLQDIEKDEIIALGRNFQEWIAYITKFLSGLLSVRDKFFSHLQRILETNVSFAEQIFPVLVHEVLRIDYEGKRHADHADSYRLVISRYFTSVLSNKNTDSRCLSCIVNTVLHLRHYMPGQGQDALLYNKWFNLDFMLLSRCAITCGAYTTALLFLELATDGHPNENDHIASEHILYDIYSHIEEPDGFYGIRSRDPRSFLLRRFRHEQQWDKSFQFHGARFESGEANTIDNQGIVESLHSFGFNKLALSSLDSSGFSGTTPGGSSNLTYQLGWRAEVWDLPDLPSSEASSSTLYSALKAVHREQNMGSVDKLVSSAMWKELQRLKGLANENLIEIRQVTQTVMCLAQIKEWRTSAIQSDLLEKCIDADSNHWRAFCNIEQGFAFDDLESILATRLSLIRSMRRRDQRDQIGDLLSDVSQSLLALEIRCLLRLSEAARENQVSQIALNSVIRAQNLDRDSLFEISEEFASVLWLQGEQRLAVEFLKNELLRRGQNSQHLHPHSKVQQACILARLGEWTSEACLEKPAFIQENYFLPAIALMDAAISPGIGTLINETKSGVFHRYALFAEQQYQDILHSDDIVRYKVYSERKKQEVMKRQETVDTQNKQEVTQLQRARKILKQDTEHYEQATQLRDTFLIQSIQMLSFTLATSDTFDGDASTRLCSLWLSNFKSTVLDSSIRTVIERVPSRKLVFLAHQLSARLTNSDDASVNQNVLYALILRMGSEHPFHSLYQVYALQSQDNGSRRLSGVSVTLSSQRERASAASDIFDKLLSASDSAAATRVRNLRSLCDIYVEWATFRIRGVKAYSERVRRKQPIKIPDQLRIRKIKNLKVPVTTYHTPLDPTMQYQDCLWINSYSDQFVTPGGVNLPKVTYCKGSDGVTYKQLFKGEGDDDLRQDAVMEQVFELCNQVLRGDRNSKKRNLSIRTYKVVPLTAHAGLLEFVVDTVPMGDWLKDAHPKYNRKDLRPNECNQKLASVNNQPKQTRIAMFKSIKQQFHPVLRHFFTEQRKLPLAWFEMRLGYSRSVATNSIVGHILGLGDRHISNILLDNASGEVVHIDLGIAFDQGKLLPFPEVVPFRLTADIIDGLGYSGTEGVFRRCAEETLKVLRSGSGVIKTVLEVFKYDPLHSWTANSIRLNKVQGGTSAASNDSERFRIGIGIDMDSLAEDEQADRALNGVARRLDKALSVEFTVNELISEAADENNLAVMYQGWSPYC